MNDGYNRID